MRYQVNSSVIGIARVSFSNILSLFVSLITSFLLPIFISVEDYGYWQLFILYTSYVGFFAFGFNDGIHLNYATCLYNKETASRFGTFKNLLLVLSVLETVVLIVFLIVFIRPSYGNYYSLLFSILNIIPVLINGLFTYLNQSTLRFKQYALGNIIDKVIFVLIMLIMIILRCKSYLFYIFAYTVSKYCVIIYHYFSSKLIFTEKKKSISSLKIEIFNNFTSGFRLMVANLLGSSIIVGSRIIIEKRFGIVEFGAYSFANHTLVIASQFIAAVASVFYPIMKRCESSNLEKVYKSFDKASAFLSSILLISYYLVVLLINLLYKQYVVILDYLFWVYPLFIFQCKSNLLINNIYKIQKKPTHLIFINIFGVSLHLIFVWIAYSLFGTVYAISCSVLLSYCVWYYLVQLLVYNEQKWHFHISMFVDFIIVFIFIICHLLVSNLFNCQSYEKIFIELIVYAMCMLVLCLFFYKSIKRTLIECYSYMDTTR